MPATPPPRPAQPRGLADRRPDVLADLVLPAWDAFLTLAADADLDGPSRLPGWTGRDVLVHLGAWPEHAATDRLLASARAGGASIPGLAANDPAFLTAHRGAGRDEVLAALGTERDAVARYLRHDAAQLGRSPVSSMLGRLPASTVVVATCYELAVHALDLRPCGAPAPPSHLLHAGLGALTDTTAALAHRVGAHLTFSVRAPDGGWLARVDAGGWEIAATGPGAPGTAAVTGSAATLLDASAGRINPATAVATGALRLHDIPTLLGLLPVLENVPGLPGRSAMRMAASGLGRATRLLSWLPRRRG